MKKNLHLIIIAIILVACNYKASKFVPFKIKDAQGRIGITVDKDGIVKSEDEQIGIIGENGTFKDKNGKEIVRLLDDNKIIKPDGTTIAIIDEEGNISNESGLDLRWSDKGELMKGTQSAGIFIEPADKNAYQIASIVLYLYLGFN